MYPFLDVPARITFTGLNGASRRLIVDDEDDGSFEARAEPRCTLVSFNDGTLVFDVSGFTTFSSEIALLSVTIDIKPRQKKNKVTLCKRGGAKVSVAVLADDDLQADQIDVASVAFGPDGASPVKHKSRDIDKDGDTDLVLFFKLRDTGIACGDTEATLTGTTVAGQPFSGTDSLTAKGCRSHGDSDG